MGIKLDYTSVYHPQTNGQVKRANGFIMSGIKPRLVRSLTESDTQWVDELDSVLWGLQTMPNRTTGYTHFYCVWRGSSTTMRHNTSFTTRTHVRREGSRVRSAGYLDALEEERDVAKAHSAFYQQQAR